MSLNKEELMRWLQKQAHESELKMNRENSRFQEGRMNSYNHVWRYLNEQED